MGAHLVTVGAGQAGLYAAYCACFRELDVKVLDSLPEPGGQISAMHPEELICDVAAPVPRARFAAPSSGLHPAPLTSASP